MRLGPRAIGSAIALVRLAKLHDRSSADTICRILEFAQARAQRRGPLVSHGDGRLRLER